MPERESYFATLSAPIYVNYACLKVNVCRVHDVGIIEIGQPTGRWRVLRRPTGSAEQLALLSIWSVGTPLVGADGTDI